MFFSAFGENQNEMLIIYMVKEILRTLSATKKNPNLELLTLIFLKDVFHLRTFMNPEPLINSFNYNHSITQEILKVYEKTEFILVVRMNRMTRITQLA